MTIQPGSLDCSRRSSHCEIYTHLCIGHLVSHTTQPLPELRSVHHTLVFLVKARKCF